MNPSPALPLKRGGKINSVREGAEGKCGIKSS